MQKFLWNTGKVILVSLFFAVLFLWYAGFFNQVYLIQKNSGPFEAIVVNTGYFNDPMEERNKLFKLLFDEDIISRQSIAITPDPFGENLITQTGWVLTPAQAQQAAILPGSHQLIKIPKKQRIVADFTYNNNFSIMAGAFTVYPVLKDFIIRKGLREEVLYEIYDDDVKRIFYHLSVTER